MTIQKVCSRLTARSLLCDQMFFDTIGKKILYKGYYFWTESSQWYLCNFSYKYAAFDLCLQNIM